MGCGMSTEEKEGKARNEEIENQLKKDKLMQRNEIKMLLLGTMQSRFLVVIIFFFFPPFSPRYFGPQFDGNSRPGERVPCLTTRQHPISTRT